MSIININCLTPKKPNTAFAGAKNFGIPKGVKGRNRQEIKGIVIHCVEQPFEKYSQLNSKSWELGTSGTPDILSVHYTVDSAVTNFVCDTDIALVFETLKGSECKPTTCELQWSLVAENPNIAPDSYLLHIAIPRNKINKQVAGFVTNQEYPCPSSSGLNDDKHRVLIKLLAYLASTYNIPIDIGHIQFKDNIWKCPSCSPADKECSCSDINQLLCDIRAYCEKCENLADKTFELGQVAFVYGENSTGCKAKQSVESLVVSRLKIKDGILGFLDDSNTFVAIEVIS
jgi:hypothetical protein